MSPRAAGRVNTTWKYATGRRSASRAASHSLAAALWHFGQCRLRQLLYEIWVCAHFSQRATWPPSAAVRQRSIALMTFNWPRLTWLALARRHAAPWSRKISATSSAGRDTAPSRYAGGWSFLLFLGLLRGCDSRSSGLSMPAIMPVAPRSGLSRSDLVQWHETDMPPWSRLVRYRRQSGKHQLPASISPFVPRTDIFDLRL